MLNRSTPSPSRTFCRMPVWVLAALVAALMLAPAAAASPDVGIGDNGPAMFVDPNFRALGTRIARKIVPYDFYRHADELADLEAWIANAEASGIDPLVAFEHSHADLRRLPSPGEFRQAVTELVSRFPGIRAFSPWNEANHHSQPTARNPRRAAQYYKIARQVCRGCRVVAADVLDIKNMVPWVKQFKRYAGGTARLWGLHSYADANYRVPWRRTATARLLGVVPGKVWLTEAGGIVAFGKRFRYDEGRAAKAVSATLRLARKSRRIERVYIYCWYGSPQNRNRRSLLWDSGLVSAEGAPRPAYRVVRDWMSVYG